MNKLQSAQFGERLFMLAIGTILLVFAFLCLFPMYNSIVLSFNDGMDALMGGVYFWPRVFSLDNYKTILFDKAILDAAVVTVARTIIGTVSSILLTSIFAYGMSKKQLMGRKLYMKLSIFTMYFGGGLIPYFLLIKSLHLRDSFWVYIIPGLVGVYNMIIFRSFFQQIPESLEESAKMDGCNYLSIFWRIIIPVSKPVYASLALFAAVYNWNDWFTATIFINNKALLPLQTLLTQKINAATAMEELAKKSVAAGFLSVRNGITSKSIVVTTMVAVTLPIIMVYPFLQKYFVKGIMLGSIKE